MDQNKKRIHIVLVENASKWKRRPKILQTHVFVACAYSSTYVTTCNSIVFERFTVDTRKRIKTVGWTGIDGAMRFRWQRNRIRVGKAWEQCSWFSNKMNGSGVPRHIKFLSQLQRWRAERRPRVRSEITVDRYHNNINLAQCFLHTYHSSPSVKNNKKTRNENSQIVFKLELVC